MSKIPSISAETYENGFCGKSRFPFRPTKKIEQCVENIRYILFIQKHENNNILCKHDIDHINNLYATIDHLERNADQIPPEQNSQSVLQTIIEVVHKAIFCKHITPVKWIELYHLQNFSDGQLQLKKYFTILSKKVSKTPRDLREIATNLPFCISKDQFNRDAQVLIGDNPPDEVTKILDRKREKLDNYEILKASIIDKKKKLQCLKQENPNSYPLYLDELLDHGNVHLYDHLLEMRALPTRNDRNAKIETLSFSSLSHIVLETREAIIEKVTKSVGFFFRRYNSSKKVLFLLGGTGAGKSTTLCFLRGDKMILKGCQYESTSDHNQLIGTSAVTSCTFLPTVEIVNDLVIIDFPGFDDSTGPLISLGMEFALKILIAVYQPKVLVLEAITNIEGKFAAAAQLGARLKRIFKNPEDCFLGITKYSRDPDFGQIRKIEEDQKNELLKPSPQEIALEARIQALSGLNMPALQPQIQNLQDQLSQLKQEKIQKQQLPLPDTALKKQSRDELQTRENNLLEQIGLGKIIRFWNLEDPNHVFSCLETLADLENNVIFVKEYPEVIKEYPEDSIKDPILDSHDKELIQRRFENNLKLEIENQKDCNVEFKDVKLFKEKVLETSLINIILSESHPEIGQFLHLDVNDPTLAQNFDKSVVKSCIEKIIKSIISNLDISFIDILLKQKIKASNTQLDKLENLARKLRDYVCGLLGFRLENPAQAEKKWKELRGTYVPQYKAEEEKWNLPIWVQSFMGIPAGILLGIYKLLKQDAKSKVEQKAMGELIDKACHELEQIYNALVELKELEIIIEKREKLDEALRSINLSLTSETEFIKSIRNKINKIRDIYGKEAWDKRIETLKDSSSYMHLIKKDGSDKYFLIALTDSLINKNKSRSPAIMWEKLCAESEEDKKAEEKAGVFHSEDRSQYWYCDLSTRRETFLNAINATYHEYHLFNAMIAAALFSMCENAQPSSTAAVQTQVINSNVKTQ